MSPGDLVVSQYRNSTSIYEKGIGRMYSHVDELYPDQVALVVSHEMPTGVTRVLTSSGAFGRIYDTHLRVVS